MNYQIPNSCQVKNLNQIYLDHFGYTPNGVFVDVGAYDGFQHSNTWGLAEAGWIGFCFEPVPEFCQQCANVHLNHEVMTYNLAIGKEIGKSEFLVAGTISTRNQNQIDSKFWGKEYLHSNKIIVDLVTLNYALEQIGVNPEFDVLSIDVEGGETDVLLGFDVNKWKPRMVIIEAQEFHEAKELSLQAPFINKYFGDAGYTKIYCDDINSIFILEEYFKKENDV